MKSVPIKVNRGIEPPLNMLLGYGLILGNLRNKSFTKTKIVFIRKHPKKLFIPQHTMSVNSTEQNRAGNAQKEANQNQMNVNQKP